MLLIYRFRRRSRRNTSKDGELKRVNTAVVGVYFLKALPAYSMTKVVMLGHDWAALGHTLVVTT